MATRIYTGDAFPYAKKIRVRLSGDPGEAATLRATIGRKYIQAQNTVKSDADILASILQEMVTVWNASTLGEFSGITAGLVIDANGDPYADFTADVAGEDFDVTFNGPFPVIDVDTAQEGADGTNEVQSLYFDALPTSGTWTITWNPGSGNQNSLTIPYNASAAIVKLCMVEGMAGLTNDDIDVSGSGTQLDPFIFAFKGAYASTNVNQITATVSSLTAKEVELGVYQTIDALSREIQYVAVEFDSGSAGTRFSFDGGATFTDLIDLTAASSSLNETLEEAFEELTGVDCRVVCMPIEDIGDSFRRVITLAVAKAIPTVSYKNEYVAIYYSGNTTVIQEFGATTHEFVAIDLSSSGFGSTLTVNGETTGTVTSLADMATELNGLASIADASVVVHDLSPTLNPNVYVLVQFSENVNHGPLTTNGSWEINNLADGGSPNEIQYLKMRATGGTYVLSYNAVNVSPLNWNDDAAAVESELESLVAISDVEVTGAGTFEDPFLIEFKGTQANTDVLLLGIDSTLLTHTVTAVITTVTTGVGGLGESWLITIHDATGGTFTLTFKDKETSAIAFGASASTVQTELRALTSVGGTNMDVSGAGSVASPYVVTCAGPLAGVRQTKPEADNTLLTNSTGTAALVISVETIQVSRGPKHWDDEFNWVNPATGLAGIPVTGDDVVLDLGDEDRSLKYGLGQSAVLLNSLCIHNTFQDGAELGNAKYNEDGYYEYRKTYLEIGLQGDKLIEIGAGDGAGSSRININIGSTQGIIRVLNTNGNRIEDGDFGAFNFIGTHASNTMEVVNGFVGIASKTGETAVLASLVQRDGIITGGRGLTIGAGTGTVIDQTGGSLRLMGATVDGKAVLVS